MSDSFFREGGPHGVRRTGPDQYEMSVSIPADSHGMVGRECPDSECSPGYFKVKPGTGITEGQTSAFCPYCRHEAYPSEFHTRAQLDYAKDVAMDEVAEGVDRMVQNALGLGPSRTKKFDAGFFSMELSYTPGSRKTLARPFEEELRRDIHCPSCGLEHAVFGLATWCGDCGRDVFLTHVDEEFATIRKILEAVETRRTNLGARVAARDLENALEDVVSIFEAVLKAITRRFLHNQGRTLGQVEDALSNAIRNRYQNVSSAVEAFRNHVAIELFADTSEAEVQELEAVFEKRHPITHNLGIVDRKYLERVRSGELQGRDLRVTVPEVVRAVDIASAVLRSAYRRLFPAEPQNKD